MRQVPGSISGPFGGRPARAARSHAGPQASLNAARSSPAAEPAATEPSAATGPSTPAAGASSGAGAAGTAVVYVSHKLEGVFELTA